MYKTGLQVTCLDLVLKVCSDSTEHEELCACSWVKLSGSVDAVFWVKLMQNTVKM